MLNLNSLEEQQLLPGTKGLALRAPLKQKEIGQQGWKLLDGDTSFPVAILKDSALQHNLAWMKGFCAAKNIVLAPHGKTTMSPQLFDLQLRNGAWGITLATVTQMQIAQRYGVQRVLLANQLVSKSDARSALQLMKNDAGFCFYALADSLAGVEMLEQAVRDAGLERPLPLLVELGFQGGRTGCRSPQQALELARRIKQSPQLSLAGMEGYEGLMVSQQRERDVQAVRAFLADLMELVRQADTEGLFETAEILVSAGGSAYFDLVGKDCQEQRTLSRKLLPVLRSGCYVTHDHGFYHGLVHDMQQRDPDLPADGLRPALEIWSMVQSRPEPDLAILTMGKRDASYDIDLPFPLLSHRPGTPGLPTMLPPGCKIEKMNDQHAYLRLPKDAAICMSLQVGDLVGCGISHPCTSFDKWQVMLTVDDQYKVLAAINTFF